MAFSSSKEGFSSKITYSISREEFTLNSSSLLAIYFFNSDQQFLNEAGIFDIDKFKTLIIELKTTNPEAYEQWKNQEKIFESQSNEQIYFNLVNAGVN